MLFLWVGKFQIFLDQSLICLAAFGTVGLLRELKRAIQAGYFWVGGVMGNYTYTLKSIYMINYYIYIYL